MDDQETRLESLRLALAHEHGRDPEQVIRTAQKFYGYLITRGAEKS